MLNKSGPYAAFSIRQQMGFHILISAIMPLWMAFTFHATTAGYNSCYCLQIPAESAKI